MTSVGLVPISGAWRRFWMLTALVLVGIQPIGGRERQHSIAPRLPLQWEPAAAVKTFYIRSHGGKCLDFGAPPQVTGGSVFLYACNGTVAQRVSVQELPGPGHLVLLRAGTKVIGVKQTSQNGLALQHAPEAWNAVAPDIPLELQNERDRNTILSRDQIFALDGDSIILAADRRLVVKVQNNRGRNRTPLVVGSRQLHDAEFWTFAATDGVPRPPTSGFVRVPQQKDFVRAVTEADAGTVIEIDADATIDLTGHAYLEIPQGVTIRGDRRGTRLGPELTKRGPDGTMLEINQPDVRITGLRLRGPSRTTADDTPFIRGVLIREHLSPRVAIDHNDLSAWTNAAVDIRGNDAAGATICADTGGRPPSRPLNVRVTRNFFHHNQRQGEGYGVATNEGGYALIDGNTFVANRHAIKSGGEAGTSYRAWHNLVLSEAPAQKKAGVPLWHTHDFDVHGIGGNGFGGRAGQYFEIAGNTFLGINRENFDVRGDPCVPIDFRGNVSRRHLTPVYVPNGVDPLWPAVKPATDASKVRITGNWFGAGDPTSRLGTGDFDGDGLDDLFLATGVAWYYAPAANAEWRLLNARSETIADLRFGDFDADGRTDVFTQVGTDWVVSWGGASAWERINGSYERVQDFAVGDFLGDRRADVFYANGEEWFISDGGVGPFTAIDRSSYRVRDLRFGDFNADGKTDVFGVTGGQWSVAFGAASGWQPLREQLSASVAGLVIADFNGDGHADVASSSRRLSGWLWKVSWNGMSEWVPLRVAPTALTSAPAVGRFDDNASADVLIWRDAVLELSAGGAAPPRRQSRQDMR